MTGAAAPGPGLEFLLQMVARIYGMAVRVRNFLYDAGRVKPRKLSCPVISVGNLTVGGTGKTPMAIWLAEMLKAAGFRPAVISRGYRGRAEKTGGIAGDGKRVLMSPETAGDEACLMAAKLKGVPVLVGADRFRSGRTALEKFRADVVILDDGFQHRRLARDLDVVLVDGAEGFGNGWLAPRGILREPLASLGRAHALVLTRCDAGAEATAQELSRLAPGKPVFRSVHEAHVLGVETGDGGFFEGGPVLEEWPKARILAFSGIARNREFFRTVEHLGGSVREFLEFSDHQEYTLEDVDNILAFARQCGADALATTEKDYVKLKGRFRFSLNLYVIAIRMDFGADAARFSGWVKGALRRH